MDPGMLAVTEKDDAQSPSDRKGAVLFLACSFLLALAVRAWALHARGVVDFDETCYYILGRNLISGGGYRLNGLPHTAFPPLYPLLVGISSIFVRGIRAAASSVSAVTGALVVVPVWFLARDIHGRRAALFAALAAAVWPALFFFSALGVPVGVKMYAGSEPTYTTLAAAGGAFLWFFARRGGLRRAAAGGLFFGLASLVRSEGPVLFAFLFAWLVIDGLLTRKLLKRRHLAGVIAAAVCMAAAYAPFLIHVRAVSGRWSLGAKLANNARIREAMWEWAVHDRPAAFARIHYALDESGERMADPYWGVTGRHGAGEGGSGGVATGLALIGSAQKRWAPVWLKALFGGARSIVPWFLVIVIGLGVLRPPWNALRVRWWMFAGAALFSSLLIGISLFVFTRHLVVLAPLFAVAAGKGLESLANVGGAVFARLAPQGTAASDAAGVTLAGAVLALMLVHGVEINLAGNRAAGVDNALGNQAAERECACRLGEVLPGGSTLMCLKPWMAMWGGFRWRVPPVAPPGRMVKYAKANAVDFVLLEPRMLYPSGEMGALRDYHMGTFDFNGPYLLFDLRGGARGADVEG